MLLRAFKAPHSELPCVRRSKRTSKINFDDGVFCAATLDHTRFSFVSAVCITTCSTVVAAITFITTRRIVVCVGVIGITLLGYY